MWAAGKALATEFERRHDRQPEKRLAPKRSGSGSHCLAHYPANWRKRIEKAIAAFHPVSGESLAPHPQIPLL